MTAINERSSVAEIDASREIVARRAFDAPRELVFDMWTSREHIANWWGPRGFTITTHEMEVRPGGVWRFVMHGPDGAEYVNRIVYGEVARPELLTYSHVTGPFFDVAVTFEEHGGRTEVTVRMTFVTAAERDKVAGQFGAVEGLHQTLDRLGELLAHRQAFTISRVFDAPRELVFRAFTDAKHIRQWFSPKTFTTPFAEVDARPGGIARYCLRAPDGKEFWGRGVYREVVEPERIVYVDSFTDPEGNVVEPAYYGMGPEHPLESLVTITFEEQDGGTKVTLRHALGIHVPERTGAIQGWTEMLGKLAELLAGSGTK